MKNPKNVRLSAFVKPERYQLTIKPDLNGFTFEGSETIYLNLEKPTKEITLHSKDLKITVAEFVHKNKEVVKAKISYDLKSETATFIFTKYLPKRSGGAGPYFPGHTQR